MKIRNIMRPTASIRADETLWRARRILARRRNKHLPVVDAGTPVGIIDALFHHVRLIPALMSIGAVHRVASGGVARLATR